MSVCNSFLKLLARQSQDLRMNNGGHKKQFDAFWDVTEKKMNELQETAVNDMPCGKHQAK